MRNAKLSSPLCLLVLTLQASCGDSVPDTAADAAASDAAATSDDAGTADAAGATDGAQTQPDAATEFPGCEVGTLESDFEPMPLTGPGVVDGALEKGDYMLSSTYLPLVPDAQDRFNELMGPLMQDMQTREGLVAFSLGTSKSCASARTLTVWSSQESMYAFVGAPAHAAAMGSIAQVTRGGNESTHWSGDEQDANWATALSQLSQAEKSSAR